MSKPEVLMLVTNPVTDDPRVMRMASTLVRHGHVVRVLGLLAEGYARREVLHGVIIERVHVRTGIRRVVREALARVMRTRASPVEAPACVPEPGVPRRHLIRDLRDLVTTLAINRALYRAGREHPAGIIHAHDLDTLWAASWLKRRHRARLIYDAHELYTEQLRPGARSPLWIEAFTRLERALLPHTDQRLTVCDSVGTHLQTTYGSRPFVTVLNAPPLQAAPAPPRAGGPKRILYHGIFARDRGLLELVEAMQHVDDCRLILRGRGELSHALRQRIDTLGLRDRVELAPPVPMVELVQQATDADIGMNPFPAACLNTRYCLPNKLFEYMMAGLAVIASDLPEMRKVVVEHDVGLVFDPVTPETVAEAIRTLAHDEARLSRCRANARAAARTTYNWEVAQRPMLAAYAGLEP